METKIDLKEVVLSRNEYERILDLLNENKLNKELIKLEEKNNNYLAQNIALIEKIKEQRELIEESNRHVWILCTISSVFGMILLAIAFKIFGS